MSLNKHPVPSNRDRVLVRFIVSPPPSFWARFSNCVGGLSKWEGHPPNKTRNTVKGPGAYYVIVLYANLVQYLCLFICATNGYLLSDVFTFDISNDAM